MRIVLFGCQKIAISIIEFILSTNHELVAVVTHDEDRDKMFSDMSVAQYCFLKKIPTIKFDGKIDEKLIASYSPDIIFSVYYRKILPQRIIDLAPLGAINLHPSLLPLNRGPNPTLFNVLRGDKYAGVSLHYIDSGMDTGDVIAQDSMLIESRTGFELNRDIMNLGVELFEDTFDEIMSKQNKIHKQDNSIATCNIKFNDSMRFIDWCKTAEQIICQVRAFAQPYDMAMSKLYNSDHCVYFNSLDQLPCDRSSLGPGSFKYSGGKLIIQTLTKPVVANLGQWSSLAAANIVFNGSGRFISGTQ